MSKKIMDEIADDIVTNKGSKPIRLLRRVYEFFNPPCFPERHKDRYKDHPFTTQEEIDELKKNNTPD